MLRSPLLIALAGLSLAACEHRLDTSSATAPVKLAVAGTAGNLVGIAPAEPTTMHPTNAADGSQPLTETPQVIAVSEQQKELSAGEEAAAMPLPGQANDHSNVDSTPSQKAGQSDPQQKETPNDVLKKGER